VPLTCSADVLLTRGAEPSSARAHPTASGGFRSVTNLRCVGWVDPW
jgi:hypothetical protein